MTGALSIHFPQSVAARNSAALIDEVIERHLSPSPETKQLLVNQTAMAIVSFHRGWQYVPKDSEIREAVAAIVEAIRSVQASLGVLRRASLTAKYVPARRESLDELLHLVERVASFDKPGTMPWDSPELAAGCPAKWLETEAELILQALPATHKPPKPNFVSFIHGLADVWRSETGQVPTSPPKGDGYRSPFSQFVFDLWPLVAADPNSPMLDAPGNKKIHTALQTYRRVPR